MVLNNKLNSLTDDQIVEAIARHGTMSEASRVLGIPRSTFKDRASPLLRGRYKAQARPDTTLIPKPKSGVKRFILTAVQDKSAIDKRFLLNLEAYARHVDATIMVSGYTYGARSKFDADFHPLVRKYLVNGPVVIADKIVFCAEVNIIPTQVDPLAGLETYTRSKWGVFPHPRVTLKSIPVMWTADPKMVMTTGTLSKHNYVQKKAGLKAEFHHVIGAVIVEVDADGDVFCRHLIATADGSFQDLTTCVHNSVVEVGYRVEAIAWGDIHPERLDPDVARGSWGVDPLDLTRTNGPNMLDALAPSYQFFHDALDMRRRNHHSIGDPHKRFEDHVFDTDCVKTEVKHAADFIVETKRSWAQSVIVDSNHDRALLRWLKTADYKTDPANAVYFLQLQHAVYSSIEAGNQNFLLAEYAFRQANPAIDADVLFLRNTDSFVICGSIECGLHGDLGANGTKGHINAFAKMGPKANIAHSHSAAIFEGIYVAGHSCKRDMIYNRGGLTSWSPSHIVTYPNGKRTLVTMCGSKFCAAAG